MCARSILDNVLLGSNDHLHDAWQPILSFHLPVILCVPPDESPSLPSLRRIRIAEDTMVPQVPDSPLCPSFHSTLQIRCKGQRNNGITAASKPNKVSLPSPLSSMVKLQHNPKLSSRPGLLHVHIHIPVPVPWNGTLGVNVLADMAELLIFTPWLSMG